MSLVDPLGKIVTEIRDDAAVQAYPCTRVRGGDPWPEQRNSAGVVTMTADVQGPGKYNRFILVRRIGRQRLPHCPAQEVQLVIKCCGLTEQDAEALACVVSDAFHARGHRISTTGVSIFSTLDTGDGGAVNDPETQQPYVDLMCQVGASTSLIT